MLKKCTIQYRKSFFSSLAELRQHLEEDHSRKEAGAAAENLGSITVQMYNLKCPYVTCGHQTFRYGTNNSWTGMVVCLTASCLIFKPKWFSKSYFFTYTQQFFFINNLFWNIVKAPKPGENICSWNFTAIHFRDNKIIIISVEIIIFKQNRSYCSLIKSTNGGGFSSNLTFPGHQLQYILL